MSTALTVSASLAQIGEFSFILAALGIALGLLPAEGRDLVLAGALLSITVNPLMFAAVEPVAGWLHHRGGFLTRLDQRGRRRLEALRRELEHREAATGRDVGLQTGELLAKLPMFTELEASRREELLTLFKPHFAEPGERLIRKGDPPDALYFISSGAVEVALDSRRIRLGPGDFFGEMALLSGGTRSADVTAVDYCQLLRLDLPDFRRFVETCPELRGRIDEVARARTAMNRAAEAQRADDPKS